MIFITVHSHILVDYFLSCMKMNEKRAIMEYYTFLQLLSNFVILFFAFSVLGWITEVTLKFIQFHRFINRGFFIGPYCPIYGWGAVAITVLVGGLLGREGTVGETFLAGMFVCGALEYFTSWYMEKMFHARWWDYSTKPMNLHGRIWAGNLILFGIGSVAIIKIIDPVLFSVMAGWSKLVTELIALLIVILMVTDGITSQILMNVVKKEIDTQVGDNTEEISKRIHAILKNRGMFLRRIHEAYPNAQAHSSRLTDELKKARKEWKAASQEFKAEQKNAADAVLGKLHIEDPKTLESIKVRTEQAEAKFNAAKLKLRDVEKRFFPKRDDTL